VGLVHGQDLSSQVIGLAIEVHRHLGPGLLESAYEECLCYELTHARIEFARQWPLPIVYKDARLDCGYRIDILVNQRLIVEIKAVENLMPVHIAQTWTYLRLSGHRVALLMNFHAPLLKDGLRRFVL
jgi:GxxExxY protein